MEVSRFVEKSGKMVAEAAMSAIALYCVYQYGAAAKRIINGNIDRRSTDRE